MPAESTLGLELRVLGNLGALYLDTGEFSRGEGVRAQLETSRAQLEQNPALLNVLASLEHAHKRG